MRLAIGIGLNSKAQAAEIVELVQASLAEAALDIGAVALIASAGRKGGSAPLKAAAAHFGVPLELVPDEDLARIGVDQASALAASRTGLESVAEAAARHFGPLLSGKRKSANATCAIAELEP